MTLHSPLWKPILSLSESSDSVCESRFFETGCGAGSLVGGKDSVKRRMSSDMRAISLT